MTKKSLGWEDIIKLLGLLIALFALIFGNNIYQQITGVSIFQAIANSFQKNPTPIVPTETAFVPTETPQATITPIVASVTEWSLGKLIYQEDFENLPIQGWDISGGIFQQVSDQNGNHVWQTSTNSQAYLTLPITGSDYAMEAKVMQVSGGQALPILLIRHTDGSPCNSHYQTYFDTYSGWLTLVEWGLTASGTCDELRVGGTGLIDAQRVPLSNNTWYKLRIEAKGSEIRVYLNDQFMLKGTSNSLHSNRVGIISYSSGSQFTFDFDDIKIWSFSP